MDLGWMVPKGTAHFQVLFFAAHELNKKQPGGQTDLQSSPTVPHSVPHSELQPNSQIYQTAKAHSITKINFPTQNLTTAFYQHFWRGTICQKSRTKARQCKFPNFPYELH